jgi:sugar phosphate isomerase/epimerase
MKYSLHTWDYEEEVQNGTYTIFDLIRITGELGFDGIEVMAYHLTEYSDAYLEKVKKALDDSNVVMSAIDIRNANMSLGADWWQYQADTCILKLYVHVASKLGCPVLVSWLGFFEDEKDRDKQRDMDIAGFTELVEYAAQFNVSISFENHRVYRRAVQLEHEDEAGDIVAVVKSIDKPNVGGCPDPDNFFPQALNTYPDEKKEIAYNDFERVLSVANHCHTKVSKYDEDDNSLLNDIPRLCSLIKASGYDGHIGFELVKPVESKEEALRIGLQLYKKHLSQ